MDPSSETTPRDPPKNGQRQTTLLVVEDEPFLLECVVEILVNSGYHVLTAKDGKEALRVLSQHQGPVDLMLSDVLMPGMNGTDLARHVIAEHPETRVILISAQMDEELAVAGLEGLNFPLIRKPFTIAHLLETIGAELAKRRATDLPSRTEGA